MQISTTHSSFNQYCISHKTTVLVIEQLLHPAPKSTVSAPWHNFNLCPYSQQILATPLPKLAYSHFLNLHRNQQRRLKCTATCLLQTHWEANRARSSFILQEAYTMEHWVEAICWHPTDVQGSARHSVTVPWTTRPSSRSARSAGTPLCQPQSPGGVDVPTIYCR